MLTKKEIKDTKDCGWDHSDTHILRYGYPVYLFRHSYVSVRETVSTEVLKNLGIYSMSRKLRLSSLNQHIIALIVVRVSLISSAGSAQQQITELCLNLDAPWFKELEG